MVVGVSHDDVLSRKLKRRTESWTLYFAQERRKQFQTDLEEYNKQVEEFQQFGDVSQIHEYQKKAHSMRNKLDNAVNYIIHINKEEEALEWNTTTYPMRKQVIGLCLTTNLWTWILWNIIQLILIWKVIKIKTHIKQKLESLFAEWNGILVRFSNFLWS